MLCFCTVISFSDIIEELINPTNEDFDFPSYNAMRNVLPRDQLQERIDQVLTIERAHEYCHECIIKVQKLVLLRMITC